MKKLLLLLTFAVFSSYFVVGQQTPDDWTPASELTTYQETTDPHGGTYSCKVDVGGSAGNTYYMSSDVPISVTGGESYKARAYVKSSTNVKVSFRVAFDDGTKQYSGGSQGDATWTSISKSNTVPAGATSVTIEVRFQPQTGYTATETCWVDDITFESPTGTTLTVANGDFESWPPVGVEPNAGDLVINEINGTGTPSYKARYTELYNTTSNNLSLDKVTVYYYDDGASSATESVDLAGTLAPGAYLILARHVDFNTIYSPLTYDFIFTAKLNGDNDCMTLVHDDNGVLDQFNDGPPAAVFWAGTHVFYRFDYTSDGSSIANDWDDLGSNYYGTPKAANNATYSASGTGNWNTATNWVPEGVPTKGVSVIVVAAATNPFVGSTDPLAPNECMDLTIQTGGKLTVGPGKYITVHGNVTNDAGNNGIFIRSTVDGSGSFIYGSGSPVGTAQRFVTSGQYHGISAPVSGLTADDLYLGGSPDVWLKGYNESTNDYTNVTNLSTPLGDSKGWMLWIETGAPDETYVFNGSLRTGNVTPTESITRTAPGSDNGYNFVGNPYTSPIDWDASTGWTKTNLANAIYVYNNGTFGSYVNGVGTDGGSRYIASGQGFFVEVNDDGSNTGTLEMTSDVQVHNAVGFLKSENSVNHITLIRLEVYNGEYKNETVIRLTEEATAEFDSQFDAHKLFSFNSLRPHIYTVIECLYSINSLPVETGSVIVDVDGVDGEEMTITATEINGIDHAVLIDNKTGSNTDLIAGDYSFTYDSDWENRFTLHFGVVGIENNNKDVEDPCRIYSSHGNIVVSALLDNQGGFDVEVFDLSGRRITLKQNQRNNTGFSLPQNIIYIVKVTGDSFIQSELIINN